MITFYIKQENRETLMSTCWSNYKLPQPNFNPRVTLVVGSTYEFTLNNNIKPLCITSIDWTNSFRFFLMEEGGILLLSAQHLI